MTSINLNQPSMNLHTDHPMFSHHLYQYINFHLPQDRPIIVLCIGTDRSTGDSLGPLVGYFLNKKPIRSIQVFGTVDEPVHAKNLKETIDTIYRSNDNPFVIAIDAALSSMPKVKSVDIGLGSLTPGAALKKKELKPIGDIYIKGYINISGFMEFSILQNTRLSVVLKMAQQIAQGLSYTDIKLNKPKTFFKTNPTSSFKANH
ncbi:spore protease YyaC [Filobacillus milosensis]|nr:spore protease YyaC [Filobacillus milosensis]